ISKLMAKNMRFWRSLALPKVLQLILAAICSAADAIQGPSKKAPPDPVGASGAKTRENDLRRHQGGHKSQTVAVSMVVAGTATATDPPAFSTAATADFEAPVTLSVTF